MSTGITRDAAFLRDVVVSSSIGVLVVDSSGVIVFSNGVLEGRLGYGPEDLLDGHLDELCATRTPVERVREAIETSRGASTSIEVTLRDADDGEIRAVATCEEGVFDGRRYFTMRFLDRSRAGDDPRIDGSQAGTEQIASDTAVGTLTAVARDLLQAESPESVAEIGLAAVERVIGSPVGCIRRFDEETNALERVATTEAAARMVDSRPAFDLDASLAGRAFRRGEPVVDRPATADARAQSEEAIERESVHVPLGEQGALTVFMPQGVDLVPADVEVTEHLASIVAAAFERTDADATVPDRTSGAGQKDEGRPGSFEHPVSEIVADTIRAETRETIRQSVCERLAATDLYTSAWFVDVDVDGEWRAIEASAGAADRSPEVLRQPESGAGDDTVEQAIETDEICLVRRCRSVSTPGHSDESHRPNETSETTVVVPLSHVDRTYGVLVLQTGADPTTTESGSQFELDIIGDVVGLAIYAAESRKLVLSEKVTELEFEVTDSSCTSVHVSEEAGAVCEIEHSTLTGDGDHLCYLRVEGATPETARDVTAGAESVTSCRVIEADGDSCLLEVVKTQSGAEAMMEVGATIRSATAEEGTGKLVVEAPISANAREVADAYAVMNPDSRLVAKRELNRSVRTPNAVQESIDDRLTEKQQSVLASAYYAGYFEWPRANTAEEVADSLGISPATLHEHLRTAERKIVELVCED